MSSFGGKLLEESLDFIRIDQFEQKNHDGFKFFLSHFHSDHFRGIFEDQFIKQLKENDNKMLYCSEFTKKLLLRKSECRIPENKIFSLAPHSPYIISMDDREPVEVRTVPAGHCPGSVMFLFEQGNIRVLYTGDFRIHPDELRKFNAFYDKSGCLKKINRLYLDATFCDPKWFSFPSREESLEEVTRITKSWLDENAEHEVGIWYISYHGLEWVLMRLAKALRLRKGIWVVDEESYNNYACISELEEALSQKKGSTRIHLCPVRERENCSVCCNNRTKTKTIKPCALTFSQKKLSQGISQVESGVLKVVYATHSSFEELVGAVKFLSPENIHICALYSCISEIQALKNLDVDIDEMKKALENKENQTENSPIKRPRLELPKGCVPFTSFEQCEEEDVITISSSEDETEKKPLSQGDLFDLDSPPL